MLRQPTGSLTYADIEALVTESVGENRTLEFKRELAIHNDESKREFLADVSAFANSAGGDIVFGIKESQGIATGILGLEVNDPDGETLRLENILRSGLDPRLPNVVFRWIATPNNRKVLVVRTARSWAAPHRVIFKDQSKFYSRSSAGKYALDVAELRAAFVDAEGLIQNIRRFRTDRVSVVESDEGPVPLRAGAKMILHIIPLSAFAAPQEIAIDSNRDLLHPLGAGTSGLSTRHTLEGFATYIGRDDIIESMYTYALLFRAGIIEAVSVVGRPDKEDLIVAPETVEWDLIRSFDSYCEMLQRHELEPPYYVFVSFTGVRGHRLYNRRPFAGPILRRDVLLLPDLLISDPTLPPEKTLRPLFDLLWNAFGYPHSFSFDKDGKYIGERY